MYSSYKNGPKKAYCNRSENKLAPGLLTTHGDDVAQGTQPLIAALRASVAVRSIGVESSTAVAKLPFEGFRARRMSMSVRAAIETISGRSGSSLRSPEDLPFLLWWL